MSKFESPVLRISEIPQIAVDSMNQTHLDEVILINQLGALIEHALQGEEKKELITDKLLEWIEHTQDHFSGENQLMEEFGFPAYPVHAGEHQKVLAQMELLQGQWLLNAELLPLAEFVFNEWPTWFDNHVNSMDMVTAHYLSQVNEAE